MAFEFATATRIIFGNGKFKEIGEHAASMGENAFVVTRKNPDSAKPLLHLLDEAQITYVTFAVDGEPTIAMISEAVHQAKDAECDMVISSGGGSVLDSGKAIAALATNPGDALDYLEVIGRGKSLENAPLPFIAIPTTAGTGAEVTKNAVLASKEQHLKVSLRHPLMLPKIALVDPELTYDVPPNITAMTGMDALTQNLEPFVSNMANPVTDGFCREGLKRAGRSLKAVYENGNDADAREDMALASLLGGLALSNAKLGAVHGFAGVIGGMFDAPHGGICAVLLPHVMDVNLKALRKRDSENIVVQRYDEIAMILMGRDDVTAVDGVAWVKALSADMQIPPLSEYGITRRDFPTIVEKSRGSSSMKGNPIMLTDDELAEILEAAL